MNGQDHAATAEALVDTFGNDMTPSQLASIHATLAVAYAQAGAWAEDPRNKVTVHVRESTDQGPDFCKPCSDTIGDWVPWPCAGSLSSEPCRTYGCVRAQGHDGNHVAANGIDWPDA